MTALLSATRSVFSQQDNKDSESEREKKKKADCLSPALSDQCSVSLAADGEAGVSSLRPVRPERQQDNRGMDSSINV